jgi:peptide/nickel transport system substrate-binding protein
MQPLEDGEMTNMKQNRFVRAALQGRMTRRQVLERGLALGLSSPLIMSLMATAPEASAAPAPSTSRWLSSGQNQDSGTFTAMIAEGTADVDPHSTYSTVGSEVCLGCYEMLIQYKGDSTSEYAPMLAESWDAAADNKTFTFKLPAGVKFQDGTDCDAAAVKASFTRFLELDMGPVNVISRFIDSADQIEAVDATTVRFNMTNPTPLFLDAMASSYGPYVVSPKAVEDNKTKDDPWAHEWLQSNAVGTGPYTLTENSLNEQVKFEKFDDYHGGWSGNHFSEVVLRVVPENTTRRQLLEQGEVDATTNNLTVEDVESLKSNPDLVVLEYGTTRVNWGIMNAVKLSKEARQGFSYAFPYDDVMNGVYKGLLVRSGPIPNTVKGADPDVFIYQTDLEKAKQLITSAGFKDGDSFEYLFSSGDAQTKSVAELFQANVAKMGFELKLSEVDLATEEDIVYGDSPAEDRPEFIGDWAWWPDYNDPWNQLAPNFLKASTGGGGSNGGYWVNDRFEEIMAQAEHYKDETELDALMKEAQNILTEQDPPAIYYGEVKYYTVLKKEIQGFVANPLYLDSYNFYGMSRA